MNTKTAKTETVNAYASEKSITSLSLLARKSGIGFKVGTVESKGIYSPSIGGGTSAVIRFFLSGFSPDKNGLIPASLIGEKVTAYKSKFGSKAISPELKAFLKKEGISDSYDNLSSVLGGKVLGGISKGIIRFFEVKKVTA
jgi:hypothetical protein